MRVKIKRLEIEIKCPWDGSDDEIARLTRHVHRLESIRSALAPLVAARAPNTARRESRMVNKTYADLTAAWDAVDARTTELADDVAKAVANEQKQLAEIQALKDQVAGGSPVTQEQLDALVSRGESTAATLGAVEANLRPLGASTADPIPTPTPVPDPGNEV